MHTLEEDNDDLGYGQWAEYTADRALSEERRRFSPPEEIWPHWNEGVPRRLRRTVGSESFFHNGVHHRYREYLATVEFNWNPSYALWWLDQNRGFLPGNYENEWSGVYRIFSLGAVIDRCCGKDPTGTLYIGMGGAGRRNWSILRGRVMAAATRDHHAFNVWLIGNSVRKRFPWETLCIEWAYTGTRPNGRGESEPEAKLAESFLLYSYQHSYGELPPWNRKA